MASGGPNPGYFISPPGPENRRSGAVISCARGARQGVAPAGRNNFVAGCRVDSSPIVLYQIRQNARSVMNSSPLKPATELGRTRAVRFPNESAEYRSARQAMLAEEIELRRHIERVAAQRRALPPGGEVRRNYAFEGEGGKAVLSDMFGEKPTLAISIYMFGPQTDSHTTRCSS